MNKIIKIDEKYNDYLSDESRLEGKAETISFPEDEFQVMEIVKDCIKNNISITIQGGRTGLVGGSVPLEGHILNMSKMSGCSDIKINEDGTGEITVKAGTTLFDLNEKIDFLSKKTPMFWPVQPSENTATIGGIISTGAEGINQVTFKNSCSYVQSIKVVTISGEIIEVPFESIELYFGSEGILGIITEAKLKLLPKFKNTWGISFFFENLKDASEFANYLQQLLIDNEYKGINEKSYIVAGEFFDRNTIDLIEENKETMSKIKDLPDIDKKMKAMIYIEIAGDEEKIEEKAFELMNKATECNSNPDKAWAVTTTSELEKLRAFCHTAIESTNLYIEKKHREDKRIIKLYTQLEMENMSFFDLVSFYEKELEKNKLRGCIFGHIGNNRLKLNFLPENYDEYLKGKTLIKSWLEEKECKGIYFENGVGKIKNSLLPFANNKEKYSRLSVEKRRVDKKNLLNPSNIFKEGKL